MATGPCQAGFAGTHYYIYLGGESRLIDCNAVPEDREEGSGRGRGWGRKAGVNLHGRVRF
jgi:hypothetical protein